MINEKENTKISKLLSLVLRHKPETIGLTLDNNGWADINDLIEKINTYGFTITTDILNHIVVTNNKKRFSFDETKTRIRANQGHSLDIELNLEEAVPPPDLFHGTGEKFISSILATGLDKRNRQHVHLSSDMETAIMVGQRHGKPKVFIVASGQMKMEGFSFYLSDNNVWLTDNVPLKYLKLIET
jgi:putative RNA 2'-phosphotransferase